MPYRIRLEKENFKFSCSHFTILGPDRAERLHGHNYYVSAELRVSSLDPTLGMAFDFNQIKPLLRRLTESFDEMVLLPENSPYLSIERTANRRVRALFAGKVYDFPEEDVKCLPIVNVTSEELARQLAEGLLAEIKKAPSLHTRIAGLEVGVEETRGQSVIYELTL